MHFIRKQISSYLDEQGVTYAASSDEDIKAFATEGSSSFTLQAGAARLPSAAIRANRSLKFLKLILLVMITPPNADIVNQIQTLPQQTQEVIYRLIQDIDPSQSSSEDEQFSESNGHDKDHIRSKNDVDFSSARRVDRELELEAQQAELQSQLNRRERQVAGLKAEKEDFDAMYGRLQETNKALKRRESELEARLDSLVSARSDVDQFSLRELEAKISQQEEIISSKEFQISEHQSHESELQRRLTKLNGVADEFQKLQDELHIQKAELLEQTKKANAGDKYKHKVQAFQTIERERDSLRYQIEEARPKMRAYEDLRRDNARLVKENREIGSTLSQSEIGNSELRETKQGVIAENDRLRRELKSLRAEYAQSQENSADSMDRSDGSEIHSSPTVMDGGLESELAITETREQQTQVVLALLEWQKGLSVDRKHQSLDFERQFSELTNQVSEKESKIVVLQQQLDGARALAAEQSAKLVKLHGDISALESSMTKVRQGQPIEGSVSSDPSSLNLTHTVTSTRTFKRLQDELQEERKRRNEAEEALAEADNSCTSSFERHCLISDLNFDLLEGEFIGKPKIESLEKAKRQGSINFMQAQGERDVWKQRCIHLQEENAKLFEERNQAWRESHEALVARTQGESNASANDQALRELTETILNAAKDQSTDLNASVEENLVPLISTSRKLLAEKQEADKKLVSLEEVSPLSPQLTLPIPSPSSTFSHVLSMSKKFFGPRDADKLFV